MAQVRAARSYDRLKRPWESTSFAARCNTRARVDSLLGLPIKDAAQRPRFQLDPEFVRSYEHRPPPWGFGDMSELVFLRTYSRLKHDALGQPCGKERWFETCERVVNGLFWIMQRHNKGFGPDGEWCDDERAQWEAQNLYERMFVFKWTPPGRGMWALGTPIILEKEMYSALQNCGFVSTKHFADPDVTLEEKLGPFTWMMDGSMQGIGVGFDVLGGGHIPLYRPSGDTRIITIDDSREGWVDSLEQLLNSYFEPDRRPVEFVYTQLRPKGAALKTFGGESGGPDSLIHLHITVRQELERCFKLTHSSPQVAHAQTAVLNKEALMNIMNQIGVCVVSGNLRRCLPEGTPVHTKRGVIAIQDVLEGDEVRTSSGWARVSELVHQGVQELARIRTPVDDIYCTDRHRVAVMNGPGSYEWKEVRELRRGDELVFVRESSRDIMTGDQYEVFLPSWSYDAEHTDSKQPTVAGRIIHQLKTASIRGLISRAYDNSRGKDLKGLIPIPVTSLKTSTGLFTRTYDISVPGAEEFVFGPGILGHNTAQIAFAEPDDFEFMDYKDYEKNPHRAAFGWTSNNSVFAQVGRDYVQASARLRKNGEPGFFWLQNAREYSRMKDAPDYKDMLVAGANPCSEQSLFTGRKSGELCTLVETMPAAADSDEDYLETLRCAHLYAKIITLGLTQWPETNEIMQANRRMGISQTGVQQFNAQRGIQALTHEQSQGRMLDVDPNTKEGRRVACELGQKQHIELCHKGYDAIQEHDEALSALWNIPKSIKTTSVKPSGSVSLLSGSTPGMHYPKSKVHVRRVRLSATDKTLQAVRDAGHLLEPEERALSIAWPDALLCAGARDAVKFCLESYFENNDGGEYEWDRKSFDERAELASFWISDEARLFIDEQLAILREESERTNARLSYFFDYERWEFASQNPNVLVWSYVVDFGAPVRATDEVSLREQMEQAALLQEHWSDNQVSCTAMFDDATEGDLIAGLLREYETRLKGISFLTRTADAYRHLPYEDAPVGSRLYRRVKRETRVDFSLVYDLNKDVKSTNFCDGDSCSVGPFHKKGLADSNAGLVFGVTPDRASPVPV